MPGSGPVAFAESIGHRARMRWSRLFADFEAQLEQQLAEEVRARAVETTRVEVGRIALADRLRAAGGEPLAVTLRSGAAVRGVLEAVGTDWMIVLEDDHVEHLVPTAQVAAYFQLPTKVAPEQTAGEELIWSRLTLRNALRALARDRAYVAVSAGAAPEAGGTLDRVGADFVDLAIHAAGEPRRAGTVRTVATIPIAAISLVTRR